LDSIDLTGVHKKPAKYYLVAEDRPQDKIEVKQDALVIGRDDSCDIVISKPHVSRRHCLVQLVGRKLRFRNLESSNGIYINGVRVRDGFVKSGDKLTLGGCTFVVHREK
jgi:pSer/pThr/pTyr-binding forkhead associated (FHA) protein